MRCPITITAIENACSGTSLAGVKSVSLANFGVIDTITYEYQIIDTKTAEEYQALTPTEKALYEQEGDSYVKYATAFGEKIKSSVKNVTLVEGEKFKTFGFKPQTASFTQTLQYSENASFWQQDISLVFSKQDSAKRLSIMSIAQAELTAIVLDNNLKYWLVGVDYPMIMNSGDVTSGTVYTDNNSYSITLSASALELALEIPQEIYNTLIGEATNSGGNMNLQPDVQPDYQPDNQGGNESGSTPDLEG